MQKAVVLLPTALCLLPTFLRGRVYRQDSWFESFPDALKLQIFKFQISDFKLGPETELALASKNYLE